MKPKSLKSKGQSLKSENPDVEFPMALDFSFKTSELGPNALHCSETLAFSLQPLALFES